MFVLNHSLCIRSRCRRRTQSDPGCSPSAPSHACKQNLHMPERAKYLTLFKSNLRLPYKYHQITKSLYQYQMWKEGRLCLILQLHTKSYFLGVVGATMPSCGVELYQMGFNCTHGVELYRMALNYTEWGLI